MALPQRTDPRQAPPSTMENLPEIERQVGTGGAFTWWWLWIPVIVAAFWFVGWGWGPYGGWWWGHGAESARQSANSNVPAAPNTRGNPANGALAGGFHNSAAQGAQIAGPGVSILESTDRKSDVGHSFQVQNVPVQATAGPHAVWIGTRTETPLLLVLPAGQHVDTNAGALLDVSGTVMKAPPAAHARREWSLSNADAGQLEGQGVYVQGTSVANAQHP